MNRRDFFKFLGLGVAGLVAPQWTTERYDMANIGDLLAKIGRNETLTTSEQQQIRLWGNQVDFNNSYVLGLQNGQSSLTVDKVTARSGFFDIQPTKALVLTGVTTVPTSDHTPAQFNGKNINANNSPYTLDPSDNTKLTVMPGSIGSTIVIFGSVTFAGGPFNVSVRLEQYDANDTLLVASLYAMANFTATVVPFAGTTEIAETATYAKLALWQSSGGNVVTAAMLNIFELI